jgi:tryptophan-rich hypothetical protein
MPQMVACIGIALMKNIKQLIINSNWTADKAVKGWRHYRISGRFYEDKILWLELMSVCDRKIIIKLEAQSFLKDDNWLNGWK